MNRTWTNRDLSFIEKYRSKLHQIQQQQIKQKKQLIDRVIRLNFTLKNNYLSFCKKLRFQTLHLKQKELTKSIKIFQKNQVKRPKQNLIRKSLKNKKEQILFLSEIYQNLEEGNDKFYFQQLNSNKIVNENLDNWNQKRLQKENQKLPKQCLYSANKRVPGQRRSGNQLLTAAFLYRQKQSLINNNMEKYNVKKFKDGANLKLQIEKFLQIIQMSNNQSNIMNRFVFVENSSKILKQQLDQKKEELQKLIKSKQQMLFRKLEQHHQIFKQKAKIIQQQKKSQQAKDQISSKLTNTLNLFPKIENKSTQAQQKFQQRIQKLNNIQTQVINIKKSINMKKILSIQIKI